MLQSIEGSAFCTWVREADSLWAYPGILFAHVAAMSALVGLNTVIGFRVLGFPAALPLAPLERFFPVIWVAFGLDVLSGGILLATDLTAKLRSPVFDLKLLLVVLAAAATALVRGVAFRHAREEGVVSRHGRLLALVSIALWLATMTIGRLMGYLSVLSGA